MQDPKRGLACASLAQVGSSLQGGGVVLGIAVVTVACELRGRVGYMGGRVVISRLLWCTAAHTTLNFKGLCHSLVATGEGGQTINTPSVGLRLGCLSVNA